MSMYSYLVVYAKVMKPELLQYSSHHQSSKGWIDTCLRFLYPLHKVLPFLQLCGRSNQDLEICLLSFMPSSQSTGSRGPRMSCSDVVPKRVLRGQRTATKLGQIGLEKIIHNNPHVFSVLVFTSIPFNSCSVPI